MTTSDTEFLDTCEACVAVRLTEGVTVGDLSVASRGVTSLEATGDLSEASCTDCRLSAGVLCAGVALRGVWRVYSGSGLASPASSWCGETVSARSKRLSALGVREIGGTGLTRFQYGHDWIIALGVCAGLGVVCVLVFEIYILYKLMGTKIGKQWRTMWLGQLLLFGIFIAYLVCFAYIWIPTKVTCGITRFGVGVSYAMCFAVLLVKLMVLLTSKTSADTLLPGDIDSPNYLRGIYQFLMYLFIVGVQVVIAIQWLIMVPPGAVQIESNNGDQVWVCNHYTWNLASENNWREMPNFVRTNFENHLISLSYVMFLIFLTVIIAMKSHGIITNHRESVFIGISAGFSVPVFIAWGLVGGLNKNHPYAQEFGDACFAFGLIIVATIILFAMFLPKVRQLVNMGVEGIYLEDDRDTYYAGSVVMSPPSYKSRPSSMVYVNSNGYSEPVVIGDASKLQKYYICVYMEG